MSSETVQMAAPPGMELTATELAIEVNSLTKTYGGKVRALRGVTFAVERGSIFALVGPNGAGKSTTIRILTTLAHPDSGEARVMGIDAVKEPQLVRRKIGCVAQRSAIDRDCTGRENLMLQGQLYGLRNPELGRRVTALLEQFELTEAANRLSRHYSGGMQRKLDIAMGLIHKPVVLFLDEPTASLDPTSRTDVWKEISRLAHSGITILLSTHYLEEADLLANKIAIIDQGSVVAEGSPETLRTDLAGDSVEIELAAAAPQERLDRMFHRLNLLHNVTYQENRVCGFADRGATAVPVVLLEFEAERIAVTSVKISRPSLYDAYLRYTGRSFQQAEKGNL